MWQRIVDWAKMNYAGILVGFCLGVLLSPLVKVMFSVLAGWIGLA